MTARTPRDGAIGRAGADLVLAEGAVFALNGSATDPEGEDLTYLWSQDPEFPAVAFNDTSSPTATITLPQVTENAEITLTLTATTPPRPRHPTRWFWR